jgi:transposase
MGNSVLKMPRPVRRRLQPVVKKSRDVDHVRRAQGLLTLHALGGNLSAASLVCGASRRALRRWRNLYESGGERALAPKPRGREDWKATAALLQELAELVRTDPTGLGYLRSRCSSELLALELRRRGAVQVHATTVRRWRARLSIVWRRARPTLHIADARKQQKMLAIRSALRHASARDEVFLCGRGGH